MSDLQRAMEFISRISRPLETRLIHDGYDVRVRHGTKFGHVRFNIQGPTAGRYRIYAVHPYVDPENRFVHPQPANPSIRSYVFDPDDQDAFRYAVGALESAHDRH